MTAHMRTILEWYRSGGPFIVPLLVVGVMGLVVLIERFVSIVVRTKINARPFIERVISYVRADKLDEALTLCAEHQSALPDLGLILLRSGIHEEDDLRQVAAASTLAALPALRKRLSWLPALAVVAVLTGILGFIANLYEALRLAPHAEVSAMTVDGLRHALRPLGAGVTIAIPLVFGYGWLVSESEAIAAQLAEFSARLVNALLHRPDVRLGHR